MSAITRPSSTNSPRSVCEHQLAHLLPQSIPTYCMRASFESDCVTKRHIVDTSEALIHEIPVDAFLRSGSSAIGHAAGLAGFGGRLRTLGRKSPPSPPARSTWAVLPMARERVMATVAEFGRSGAAKASNGSAPGPVGYVSHVAGGFTFRSARADDVGAIARVVADAFQGYLEFAPAGGEPPGAEDEIEHLEPLMRDPEFWCLVAERDGGVVGHSAFVPARTARGPEDDDGLVHLRALFVDREWWGSGVARTLHSMALEEAARRGFTTMRLFTPIEHPRARRFYEREGWKPVGELLDSPLGLPLIEYRRGLTG